jgi:N4-gp56 family major capsid protein
MATTAYGVNHNETVKLWARKLFHEALKATWIYKFIGKDSSSMVQLLTDTQKGPGDRVRVILRMLLSGAGIQGDGTLEGNEEALTTYTDDLVINQLRHSVRSAGKMTEQRIPFSIREEARLALTDWWADRFDTWVFNQLGSATYLNDTRYTGNQSVTTADSSHVVYPLTSIVDIDATANSVASNSASAVMTLSVIDKFVEKAKTLSPQIRPLMIGGEQKYVCFVHPYQEYDLRTNTNTGQWLDIQKAAVSGGQQYNNPIYKGALGEYNNTIIHVSTRVPLSASASVTGHASVRSAIFCGAQAATLAFGQGHGPEKFEWVEELFDYQNQLGVAAGCIGGAKKTQFNSADYGVLICPTWAAAH